MITLCTDVLYRDSSIDETVIRYKCPTCGRPSVIMFPFYDNYCLFCSSKPPDRLHLLLKRINARTVYYERGFVGYV